MEAERAEEREVLQSIYDGDGNFSQLEDNLFQYKYTNCGENKNFVLEVKWGENYPEEAPEINLDVFYNKHIFPAVKESIVKAVLEQASTMLGMSMTFTLIEWLKDNHSQFLEQQDHLQETKNAAPVQEMTTQVDELNINGNQESSKPAKKKEVLSKNQKRRMWDRQNAAGERERGWDWMDVIKHLSQTGGAPT